MKTIPVSTILNTYKIYLQLITLHNEDYSVKQIAKKKLRRSSENVVKKSTTTVQNHCGHLRNEFII
jgi:hypothetical protein